MAKMTTHDILQDPDFKEMYTKRMRIAWTLTVLELILYFGFVYLVSFKQAFLSERLSSDAVTTKGIPIAVLTIVISWILTGIYVFWANSTYDGLVNKVKAKIGG
jgi:uncharacterized membrane protein (DUF485 family)